MPKWLVPWVLPIGMLIGVVGGAASSSLGLEGAAIIIWCLLLLAVLGFLIRLRLRYLKEHPPEPELVRKPFWRF